MVLGAFVPASRISKHRANHKICDLPLLKAEAREGLGFCWHPLAEGRYSRTSVGKAIVRGFFTVAYGEKTPLSEARRTACTFLRRPRGVSCELTRPSHESTQLPPLTSTPSSLSLFRPPPSSNFPSISWLEHLGVSFFLRNSVIPNDLAT